MEADEKNNNIVHSVGSPPSPVSNQKVPVYPRKTKSLDKNKNNLNNRSTTTTSIRSTKLTRSSSTPLDSKQPRKRANSTTEKNNSSNTNITPSSNNNNFPFFQNFQIQNSFNMMHNRLQSSTNFLSQLTVPNLPKFNLQPPSFKNFEIKNSYTKTISLLKNQQCMITLPTIYNKKFIKSINQTIFENLEENNNDTTAKVKKSISDNEIDENGVFELNNLKMKLSEVGRRTSSVLCMSSPVVYDEDTFEEENPPKYDDTTTDSDEDTENEVDPSFDKILYESNITITVSRTATAEELYKECVQKLDIIDPEYFGIYYLDRSGQRIWLVHNKPIADQLGFLKFRNWNFYFSVKHYPQHAVRSWSQMNQQTLDLMYLCCRQDISSGHLPASFVSHVLLGALAKNVEGRNVRRLKSIHKMKFCESVSFGNVVVPFAPNESKKLTESEMKNLFKLTEQIFNRIIPINTCSCC